MMAWILSTWHILAVSAPWLLTGLFFAGLIHALLPSTFVHTHFRRGRLLPVIKAVALGIPLPLCSCSVIPVAVALRRRGANKGAVSGFLVSTPEIGIDSFLLSWALLGPILTMTRLVAAASSAITVGLMMNLKQAEDTPVEETTLQEGCCAECPTSSADVQEKPDSTAAARPPGVLRRAWAFGFGTLAEDLAPVLLAGFLLAGLVSAFVPQDYFARDILSRDASIFLALLVSLPTYVCSLSSTPLAAALLSKGFDPGAVIVFLLAGPATNVVTMLAVRKELGRWALVPYLGTIVTLSVLFGYLVDLFINWEMGLRSVDVSPIAYHGEWSAVAGSVLLAILLFALLRRTQKQSLLRP